MQKPGELEKRASGVAIAAPPPTNQLPVTLLSGFLGAGKTTLLKRILQGTHGLKIAVIVNDMAELNIDGAFISKSGGQLVQTEQKLVQMQNGCICCTLREDLLEEVAKLAHDGSFDYCVIESTGISEPMQVAETFSFELPEAGEEEGGGGGTPGKPAAAAAAADAASHGGKRAKRSEVASPSSSSDRGSDLANNTTSMIPSTLAGIARLDTCVTMIDASKFWDDLQSIEELADRHPDETPEGDDRNIAALLIDQIEFADVLILNKCDIVSKGQVKAIRALLARLNPLARILQCVRAQVPLKEVMSTGLFDLEKASRAPGWIQAIDRASKELRVSKIVSEKDEYGVASFVYTARRPFHPGRLYRDFLRRFFLSQVVDAGDEDGEVDDGSDGSDSSSSSSDEEEGGGGQAGGAGCKKEELSKYQAARDEVLAAAKAQLGGLMRSKGFFWLATQPKHVLGWSSAGALLQVTREGPWFACVPKEHWPGDEEVVARITADFCTERPEVGDRRQELVFIGQDLKEAAIRMALDACLASDEEVALAAEGQLRDELFGGDEEEGSD